MVKIEACLASELLPGNMNNVILMGRTVLLANAEGRLFALDGVCPGGGNLADGTLVGHVVRCTNGAEYDLRTGRAVERPGVAKTSDHLKIYPIFKEDDCILVDL